MATSKQLDNQGEEARKLYKKLTDSSQDYNSRRKEQTQALRDALAPVWSALADGRAVNGQKDKLSWCKWANTSAKNPERYFYKLMKERKPNSVQSRKKFNALDYVRVEKMMTVEIDKSRYSIMGINIVQDKKIPTKFHITLEGMLHLTHINQQYGPACKPPEDRRSWFKMDHYVYAPKGTEPTCKQCGKVLEKLRAALLPKSKAAA